MELDIEKFFLFFSLKIVIWSKRDKHKRHWKGTLQWNEAERYKSKNETECWTYILIHKHTHHMFADICIYTYKHKKDYLNA